MASRGGARKDSTASAGPALEVMDNLKSEIKYGIFQLASGKPATVVTNCAALGDPRRTRDIRVYFLRGEIGGRDFDVMRDTGCEGVVVRKGLIEESQLTSESYLLRRITEYDITIYRTLLEE
ncbi:hypothetical protein PoB_003805400 [Plakobranchus ocellatus]|uniref:Uncharacterized protein n=1 Tax=Plakobranchus ocellatus TaxID=259542 RepID=A0AAV4AZN3_9GAST|nr:hypothetical protein PoB_003805400 [Plakobranchus ocellatus]